MKAERIPHIFICSVFFVLGFTLVFSAIGVLLQTLLSRFYYATDVLRIIGGFIITSVGIIFLVRTFYRLPLGSRRLGVRRFSNDYISSFIFGTAFAVGWTPCVGFLEISLFGLAVSSPMSAFALLLAFSFGLGTPFLVVGLFASKISSHLEKSRDLLKYIGAAGGVLLIFIGLLIITNNLVLFLLTLFGSNNSINTATAANTSLVIAYGTGLLAFFSPCILPVLAAFFSYLMGTHVRKKK